MDTDILVAGAGPSGLVAACALASHGLRVRVADRAPGPAATSRANILHARGVEVLTRLGALGDLPERALAPVGMAMYARGRALGTMRFAPDDREAVQPMFVSQAAIESRLRDRLAELGGTVEWGREVTGAREDGDGVTVAFADGGSLRAGYLVGCDGARSTVRGLAGIGFPGVEVIEQFLLADVRARWDRPRTVSGGWFARDGMLLAIPMRDDDSGDLWRLMADVPATGERLSPEQITARLHGLLTERAGQAGVEFHRTEWTSVFRVQRRLADTYRAGRILLAGDAAHIHSPIGGQGMNTGIGDAENLAWKLALVAAGRAEPALLDTYTAERRPLAKDVLHTTTANTKVLAGETWAARLFRDAVFVPLLNLPAVQRQATRTASQLWVTYRGGPLGGRHAGERVPDRDCVRPDGTPVRLHSALSPAWALLASGGEDVGVTATADLARRYLGRVETLRTDGLAGLTLVRPDGHAAWRGTGAGDLARWLTRTLRAKGAS